MESQNAYKMKMTAQLKEWSAQINLLEAKFENSGADMKVFRTEQLCALRAKQHAASEKLRTLGISSGEAWVKLKETTDKVWEDLKNGLAEAHSKFK